MKTADIVLRVVIFLLGFFIFFSFFQFAISVHPGKFESSNIPYDFGLEFEIVSFNTSDGEHIAGWWIPNERTNKTIIVGHGYSYDKGNMLPAVSFLASKYNLLLYDHRYFGGSSGSVTTLGVKEVHDISAAVEFVKDRSNGSIGFLGFSLSASTMLMHCDGVSAIVAEAPYASMDNILDRIYFMFGPVKHPFVKMTEHYTKQVMDMEVSDISPVTSVVDCDIPMLLIHGSLDKHIPVTDAHELKAANDAIELWEVAGAAHGEVHAMYPNEYEKRVLGFFKKNMK